MDEAKRKQFISRLSRALGREQALCPAYVEGFDYSKGPQETMFKDLSQQLFAKDAETNNGTRTYFQWDASLGRDVCISNTANADIGVTFPYCGIAETATVVQASGVESGRAISLLPDTHIAIVYTDSIRPRMTQTMEHLQERYDSDPSAFPSNICLISGPSRTADIELVRVDG